MKVQDLFEAKRVETDTGHYTPGYDPEAKIIIGSVKDWLARMNATKADVADAVKQAKELPSYAAILELGAKVKGNAQQVANGTFVFSKPHAKEYPAQYIVYANGQIRSASRNRWGNVVPTRLKTPKPRLVAGDPVASLVKIYDGAFKELVNKIKSAKGLKEEKEEKQLSFSAFKKAKKRGVAKDFPEMMDAYGLDPAQKVIVYPGSSMIEVNSGKGKRYSLIIGNTEWASDDLADLEKTLYAEWYVESNPSES